MTAIYSSVALRQIPRMLGMLDREERSTTYGSFDREHWAWKFRDFPLTMLQMGAHPLAYVWKHRLDGENPYHQNGRLREWIEGALKETCRRQHRNGAFDSVGPWTQDHGVTLAMVYGLTETAALLGGDAPSRIRDAVALACRFAARSSEDYAFITNHQALFALAYLNAAELLEDAALRQRAETILAEIVRRQSSEGWYQEYDGPDAGYGSLGVFYLAECWRRTQSESLLQSLARAVEFFSWCVHPDGSVGGVYGSRHTSLYYPAGFEILTARLPMAAAIARFLRHRLALSNVVTPDSCDAENLPSLTSAYLEAARVAGANAATPPLPCESWQGVRHFPDSGLVVAGTDVYYAVANLRKGGVSRVFEKSAGKLAYEDAGYIARVGTRRFSSQLTRMSAPTSATGTVVACDGTLGEVTQTLPTPVNFIVLRLMNLTLFRSLVLGAWVRRRILNKLILGRRSGPLHLQRSLTFTERTIVIRDCLKRIAPACVESVELARSFTSIHMGSAKYFHVSELQDTQLPASSRWARELNEGREAVSEFTLQFPGFHPDGAIAMEVTTRQ